MGDGVKICIAIAVHNPERLDRLPGALTAARSIIAWADALKYRTCLITDEDTPVTRARLKAEIQPLISDPNEVRDRIVLAFAGHGVSEGLGDLWLLSDWHSGEDEAVDVQRLRGRLATYQPSQLTVISDACRTSLPPEAMDLRGSLIFDRQNFGDAIVDEDVLRATGLGKPAFMVPGRADGKSYCLFTEIVSNALWGHYPESVDAGNKVGRAVTSQTLKTAVRAQLQRAANALNERQVPDIITNFTPPNDVYTRLADIETPAEVTFGPVELTTPAPRTAVLDQVRGGVLGSILRPPSDSLSGNLIGTTRSRGGGGRGGRAAPAATPQQRAARFRTQLEAEASQRPTHFETGTGLAVFGAEIADVVVVPAAKAFVDPSDAAPRESRGRWWVLEGPPGPLLVQLTSGCWLGAALYPGMIASFTVEADGTSALVYRPSYEPDPAIARATEQALGALHNGLLGGNDALTVAARIRDYKHVDPTLGAISAYLYARIGDLQSIRQVAAYYCMAGQPIPYDVALLGRLKLRRDGTLLRAEVPATPERPPLTADEAERPFTTAATVATEGAVAGAFPWLRQGWSLLEDFAPVGTHALPVLASGTTRAMFTTLEAAAGQALAELITEGYL